MCGHSSPACLAVCLSASAVLLNGADGEPLAKKTMKKLEKLWKTQEKLHNKYFPAEE